jgi:hypothetical protein
MTTKPITTISELIERLEAIRADLDPKRLTMTQFEHLGWARRPVDCILERAREEQQEREDRQPSSLQLRPLAKCGAQ